MKIKMRIKMRMKMKRKMRMKMSIKIRMKIKQINGYFKMIDESKPFEHQINLLKKINFLYEYWNMRYYDDDKDLNLKIFKLKFAYISNVVDEKLFEEVFGYTFVTLANKLVNTKKRIK